MSKVASLTEYFAGTSAPAVNEKLLEEVFGKADTDEGDHFLKNYIAHQAWDEDAEENHVPLHEKVFVWFLMLRRRRLNYDKC